MSEARYTKEQISNLAEDVLEFYSNKQYPVKVLSIAHNLGLQVFKTTFSRDDVSGMLKAREAKIYIAESDGIRRQRFSIAHEIGHYVLHYKGNIFAEKEEKKHISYRNNLSSLGFSIKEIEANFFAANLLMPQDRVKELYEQGFSLYEIADFFQVSYTAMAHRFDFLGYD
ncbi:ImmA/IrrE family metallo-endopeptidase [Helicobacter typhlonius]|uniref:ImmA/IrrE family metallo-endopeptidase n=1 Tax=Helicobacter typhlonius TaxID=76936 RepID=UPI002FE27CD1